MTYKERADALVAKRNHHATLGETFLSNAEGRHASSDYAAGMLARSTAHSTLAILYQGQLDALARP